jgi:hypothetical protein
MKTEVNSIKCQDVVNLLIIHYLIYLKSIYQFYKQLYYCHTNNYYKITFHKKKYMTPF